MDGSRDVRVDFLRGIALLVIFIDHVHGNVLARVTYHLSGFADAAGWFVLLSGFVVGIAYRRALERTGFWRTQAKAAYRAGQLYIAHLATLFLAVGAFHVLTTAGGAGRPAAGSIDFSHLQQCGAAALWEAATLRHLPPLFDILPVYMLFILGAPLFLAAVRTFGWRLPLAASALAYAVPLVIRDANLPNLPGGHWYLNPLSWQFLFCIGACAGACGWLRRDVRDAPLPLVRIAAALFAAGFAVKTIAVAATHHETVVPWVGKTALEPVLLVHFLALVILVLRFLPHGAAVLSQRWAQAVVGCGSKPLPIFCAGVILSIVGSVLVAHYPGLGTQLAVSVAGCAILLAGARAIGFATGTDPQPQTRQAAADITPAAAPVFPLGRTA